jgi:hypothetical protein
MAERSERRKPAAVGLVGHTNNVMETTTKLALPTANVTEIRKMVAAGGCTRLFARTSISVGVELNS